MKQNLNKKLITILSMLFFCMGLLISFNTVAKPGGEPAAREAGDAALQSQIDGLAPVTYTVGDTFPDGRIVFYVDVSGEHGLEAQPFDEGNLNWYEAGTAADAHGPGWRLPTKSELDLMYNNLYLQGLGGFPGLSYWSSTEFSSDLAWGQFFGDGSQLGNFDKDINTLSVRAVRAF